MPCDPSNMTLSRRSLVKSAALGGVGLGILRWLEQTSVAADLPLPRKRCRVVPRRFDHRCRTQSAGGRSQ